MSHAIFLVSLQARTWLPFGSCCAFALPLIWRDSCHFPFITWTDALCSWRRHMLTPLPPKHIILSACCGACAAAYHPIKLTISHFCCATAWRFGQGRWDRLQRGRRRFGGVGRTRRTRFLRDLQHVAGSGSAFALILPIPLLLPCPHLFGSCSRFAFAATPFFAARFIALRARARDVSGVWRE